MLNRNSFLADTLFVPMIRPTGGFQHDEDKIGDRSPRRGWTRRLNLRRRSEDAQDDDSQVNESFIDDDRRQHEVKHQVRHRGQSVKSGQRWARYKQRRCDRKISFEQTKPRRAGLSFLVRRKALQRNQCEASGLTQATILLVHLHEDGDAKPENKCVGRGWARDGRRPATPGARAAWCSRFARSITHDAAAREEDAEGRRSSAHGLRSVSILLPLTEPMQEARVPSFGSTV